MPRGPTDINLRPIKLSSKIVTAQTALDLFDIAYDEFFDTELVHIYGSITDSIQQAAERGGTSGSTGYGTSLPSYSHFPGLDKAYQWNNYTPWHDVTEDEIANLFYALLRSSDRPQVWINRVRGDGILGLPSGPYPRVPFPDLFADLLVNNALRQDKVREKGRFVAGKESYRESRRFPPRYRNLEDSRF